MATVRISELPELGAGLLGIDDTLVVVHTGGTYQTTLQQLVTFLPQGQQGPSGPAGTNGNAVLYGTAAPTTEGVNGDFYIRTTTNFIYGPKAAGVWPAGTSLVGPTGPSGDTGTFGKQAIYIAAGGITPSTTGGCASLTTIASASNQPDIQTLDFDTGTPEYAQFGIVMPKKWNEGTITFKAHWSHAATTVNFGVAWALQAVAVTDDGAIAVAFGTAVAVTDTGGTTNDLYQTAESSAITVAGSPTAENMVFFRVYRDTANGSDNMAIDARLHGITVYVTTDAGTDA